jgi:hypothetical protein
MSSQTLDNRKNLKERIKRLEEKYDLSLDYELETDEKISNLFDTVKKLASGEKQVEVNYDYRKKAKTKKRTKKSKKNKRKRKTKRKTK